MVHIATETAGAMDHGNAALRSARAQPDAAVVVIGHHGRPLVWSDEAVRRLEDIARGSRNELTGVHADNLMLALLHLTLAAAEAGAAGSDTTTVNRDGLDKHEAVPHDTVGRVLPGGSGDQYILRATPAFTSVGEGPVVLITIDRMSAASEAPPADPLDALTPREREIASLAARGDSTKAIAQTLGLSRHTVQEHLTNACCRLNVRGRRELIARLFVDLRRAEAARPHAPSPRV